MKIQDTSLLNISVLERDDDDISLDLKQNRKTTKPNKRRID